MYPSPNPVDRAITPTEDIIASGSPGTTRQQRIPCGQRGVQSAREHAQCDLARDLAGIWTPETWSEFLPGEYKTKGTPKKTKNEKGELLLGKEKGRQGKGTRGHDSECVPEPLVVIILGFMSTSRLISVLPS